MSEPEKVDKTPQRKPYQQSRPHYQQNRPPYRQNRQSYEQNQPSYEQNRPPYEQNRPPYEQNRPPYEQNRPPCEQERPPYEQNRSAYQQNRPPHQQNRPPHQQNRPPYSERGRGRFNPQVNKALQELGVRDLREWLDQKHQGQEKKPSRPPPDPSYNYLKDPLRDDSSQDNQSYGRYREQSERNGSSRSYASRGGRGRGSRPKNQELISFIHDPVNIRVELSMTTGERNYKIDEGTKLANIKHVPDHMSSKRRYYRGESSRSRDGRSRGRGRGRGRYNSNPTDKRTTSKYFNKNPVNNSPPTNKVDDVPAEENWDLENDNSPPVQNAYKESEHQHQDEFEGEENEETYEQAEEYLEENEYFHEEYDQKVEYPGPEGYHEKDYTETEHFLEEGLVVTSSMDRSMRDAEKRIVTFKLEEQKEAEASNVLGNLETETDELSGIVKSLEKTKLNENSKETLDEIKKN